MAILEVSTELIKSRSDEMLRRCEQVLQQHCVGDVLVSYNTEIHSDHSRQPFPVFSVFVSADRSVPLLHDINIYSRSVDGLVSALDAALRAQLWHAREPDAKEVAT